MRLVELAGAVDARRVSARYVECDPSSMLHQRRNRKRTITHSAPSVLAKVATGIDGFDEITGGGLPEGRPTLVCGGPGCGKTLMVKSLAARLAAAGSPVLFFAAQDFVGEWAKAVRREIALLTDSAPSELIRAIANGPNPVFLIVDGVNELAGSGALAAATYASRASSSPEITSMPTPHRSRTASTSSAEFSASRIPAVATAAISAAPARRASSTMPTTASAVLRSGSG